MRIVFHPDFPREIKIFEAQYYEISERLGGRFRLEIEESIGRIKSQPGSAGHFLNVGSKIAKEIRRRNLRSFPFFILYAVHEDFLIFRSVIPSASDPLTWLGRFAK